MSGIYLGLLFLYLLAIRGLKKREARGLWVYSLLVLLFFGLYLYEVGFRLRYTIVITIDSIQSVPYLFFFAAPPLIIPLMPLADRKRWALPTVLFGVLVVSFGVMTWGWHETDNWDRKEVLLFDQTYWTDELFVSDATLAYSDGLLLTVDEAGKTYAYVSKASVGRVMSSFFTRISMRTKTRTSLSSPSHAFGDISGMTLNPHIALT